MATSCAAARSLASRTSRLRRIDGGLRLDPVGGQEGQTLREEVVAAVAVGDVDDVALLADLVDVGAQDELHASSSVAPTVSSTGSVGVELLDRDVLADERFDVLDAVVAAASARCRGPAGRDRARGDRRARRRASVHASA